MFSSLDHLMKQEKNDIYEIETKATGPEGSLPLNKNLLLNSPSGDLFGLSKTSGWAGSLTHYY
ncbi:hypothetical protein ACE1TI_16535 [Alteribacillus sp. JSM 102045]|uniref:hypothetical protein n=1 Tax=Alteribacillus sp. JSM 102045 TaxID=1562101 RepID=UPI0035BF931E